MTLFSNKIRLLCIIQRRQQHIQRKRAGGTRRVSPKGTRNSRDLNPFDTLVAILLQQLRNRQFSGTIWEKSVGNLTHILLETCLKTKQTV